MRLRAHLFLVFALVGCGDDSSDEDDNQEPSAAEALCEDICARVDAAACENADSPCVPSCLHNAEPCPTQAKAWFDCNPTISCNQDGRPISTTCIPEWTAYGECAPG
jgi:hypothetical protein